MLRNTPKYKLFTAALSKSVRGRTVLDIGTGSGILALLSVACRAEKVIAVDRPPVAAIAQAVCGNYRLEDKIEIRRGDVFDLDFDGEVFDVIMSETLGYLGFEENIHNLLLYGRERLGHDASILIPSRLAVMVEPVTSMCALVCKTPYLTTRPEEKISGKRGERLQWVDLSRPSASQISMTDIWHMEPGTVVCAAAVYFDACLVGEIFVSNRRNRQWPHCVIPLSAPVTALRSEKLTFVLELVPNSAQAYDVSLRLTDARGQLLSEMEFASTDIDNKQVLPSAASIAEIINCTDYLLHTVGAGEDLPAAI
jgi:hypothetical protein